MRVAQTNLLLPSMLFCNGVVPTLVTPGNGEPYWNVGNGAYWEFVGGARRVDLDVYVTGYPQAICVRSFINGIVVIPDRWFMIPPVTNAPYTTNRLLLPAGPSNTVRQIIVPAQAAFSAGAAPQGTYPIRARWDAPMRQNSPTTPANRLLVVGDSIDSGGVGVSPATFGWAGLLARGSANGGYNGSVTLWSWGTRRLNDVASTLPLATAFVTAVLALNPTKVAMDLQSNDQAVLPNIPVATHQTQCGWVMDQFNAQAPTLPVRWRGMILRQNPEVANSLGAFPADFRTAMSAALAARPTYTTQTYTDGSTFCPMPSGYGPDLVHPSTFGNAPPYMETNMLALANS